MKNLITILCLCLFWVGCGDSKQKQKVTTPVYVDETSFTLLSNNLNSHLKNKNFEIITDELRKNFNKNFTTTQINFLDKFVVDYINSYVSYRLEELDSKNSYIFNDLQLGITNRELDDRYEINVGDDYNYGSINLRIGDSKLKVDGWKGTIVNDGGSTKYLIVDEGKKQIDQLGVILYDDEGVNPFLSGIRKKYDLLYNFDNSFSSDIDKEVNRFINGGFGKILIKNGNKIKNFGWDSFVIFLKDKQLNDKGLTLLYMTLEPEVLFNYINDNDNLIDRIYFLDDIIVQQNSDRYVSFNQVIYRSYKDFISEYKSYYDSYFLKEEKKTKLKEKSKKITF